MHLVTIYRLYVENIPRVSFLIFNVFTIIYRPISFDQPAERKSRSRKKRLAPGLNPHDMSDLRLTTSESLIIAIYTFSISNLQVMYRIQCSIYQIILYHLDKYRIWKYSILKYIYVIIFHECMFRNMSNKYSTHIAPISWDLPIKRYEFTNFFPLWPWKSYRTFSLKFFVALGRVFIAFLTPFWYVIFGHFDLSEINN